jgi:hypothetical protein
MKPPTLFASDAAVSTNGYFQNTEYVDTQKQEVTP